MPGLAAWLFSALAVMLAATPAAAGSIFELNFWMSGPRYDGKLPTCNDEGALNKVALRFSEKEGKFWNSKLTIVAFDQVRETAYRPWAANSVPRRFCSAVAFVSDGLKHPIHYSIAEDLGMIGGTYGVEWCVVGLDRNMAYSPACKMARP
jgi:hypothetical protein